MKNVLLILCTIVCVACADAIPEPVTGRTSMTLPNGRLGWAVWCRGGQARCWWEAARTCGTDGYRVFDQSSNVWTETEGYLGPGLDGRTRGYVQQSRHSNGSVLIECGPFQFAQPKPVPKPTPVTTVVTPEPTSTVPDTGRDFRRDVPF